MNVLLKTGYIFIYTLTHKKKDFEDEPFKTSDFVRSFYERRFLTEIPISCARELTNKRRAPVASSVTWRTSFVAIGEDVVHVTPSFAPIGRAAPFVMRRKSGRFSSYDVCDVTLASKDANLSY